MQAKNAPRDHGGCRASTGARKWVGPYGRTPMILQQYSNFHSRNPKGVQADAEHRTLTNTKLQRDGQSNNNMNRIAFASLRLRCGRQVIGAARMGSS